MATIGGRHPSAHRGLLTALAATALVFSCDMSTGFLSDSERGSVYTLTISSGDGVPLTDGDVVLPGTEIAADVAKKTGAGDLASLDFSLSGKNGGSASGLRLFTSAAKTLTSSASNASVSPGTVFSASKSVAGIDGKLTGFILPETIASGSYVLSVSVSGADGVVLQQRAVNIFVGRSRPIIESVSTFPPSVEPGASVLLGLTVSWQALAAPTFPAAAAVTVRTSAEVPKPPVTAVVETHDPWIRWRRDGSTFAEGLFSEGLDKVVWPAPRSEGAYPISVEVFPAAPPQGLPFSFKAPVRQDLKVMVISPPGGSGDDFADSLAFFSLLRLDGTFDDAGTRPRTVQPQGFGSPALDIYSSGFGYRFDESSGVRVPGLMPPTSNGGIAAFAILLRLDSDQSDGVLVRFVSDDGSYALVFGIKDSKPYVESLAAGKTQRSTALSPIQRFPLTLEAVLEPEGDRLSISWNAEGERIRAPSMDLPPPPPEGSAQLGGAQSLSGVYDGFGMIVGGASPSYRLASRRKWKASLVVAESFEDGTLPQRSNASAGVSASAGHLAFEPGAKIVLEPSFGAASAYVIEADIEGDRSSCSVVLSTPRDEAVLSVGGTGAVFGPAGKLVGSIPITDGRISFSLEPKDGKIFLRGTEGSDPITIPSSARLLVLSLRRDGGSGMAVFDRVLVRASSSSSPAQK